MLRSFSATNYRNVTVKDLPLKRTNVLVGPNNGGKSNLIDAMWFYPEILIGETKVSRFLDVIEARGYGEILNRKSLTPGDIDFRWAMSFGPQRDVVVALSFRVGRSEQFPAGFFLTSDLLEVRDPKSLRSVSITAHGDHPGEGIEVAIDLDGRRWERRDKAGSNEIYIRQRAAKIDLAAGPPAEGWPLLGENGWIVNRLARWHRYAGTKLSPSQMMDSARRNLTVTELDSSGSELVNVLHNLDRKHDFLPVYEERLRGLIPSLERIKIDDVSDTHKSLSLRIAGQRFRFGEMSDGTLKAMALALLFHTPEKYAVLSIDEPELNLHPAWLRVIAKWAQEAPGAEQVILSTHSSDLLDGFTEGFRRGEVAVIVCNPEGRGIRSVEPAELDEFFQQGWDLGDLYRVGEPRLGGWPW